MIAEVTDEQHAGRAGFSKVSTALVPLEILEAVLVAPGGIGWEVESWGPHPCVEDGQAFATRFWVDGRKGTGEKFDTILNSWSQHDQEVVLPDNVMLMTYGLVPRYLGDGTICWDDPRGPVYDVVRVRSHVDYAKKDRRPLVHISMRRDYLEDYCSLKRCAAVAVFYEERFSEVDPEVPTLLNGKEGRQFELPGRLLGIANLGASLHSHAPQFSRVWGCRQILKPTGRPISDAKDPDLVWPDYPGAMTLRRASEDWICGYVSDAVLEEYESRSEFAIQPQSGGVSYGGWWSTSFTSRVGREHIRVELKRLYEGCPPHVISHWHRFAVPRAVAERDQAVHGERSIAVRARELMYGYLRVSEALELVSERVGTGFTQEEIGALTTAEVDYVGWWSQEVMRPVAAVVRLTDTQDQFLGRVASIFKLFELLKPAPLRAMLLKLGIPRERIREFASLRLLATLCQICVLAEEEGHDLVEDSSTVIALWDPTKRIPALNRLFALNGLRVLTSHVPGEEHNRRLTAGAAVFGIDTGAMVNGWGYAVDALYDGLVDDLNAIAQILRPS